VAIATIVSLSFLKRCDVIIILCPIKKPPKRLLLF
jgi:hypothetical protein